MEKVLLKREDVLAQVDRLCKSNTLNRFGRGLDLLRYLVNHRIEDEPNEGDFKQTVIGVAVYNKPADYDPKKEPDVKVGAGRLRLKLDLFYATEGRREPIKILIPMGSYIPSIFPNDIGPEISHKLALNIANAKAAFTKRTIVGHQSALNYIESANKQSPGEAQVLALEAMVHTSMAMYGRHPRTELEYAESLLRKIKGAHQPWERYLTEAWITASLYFDWGKADALFNRAIEMSHGEAKHAASWYMAFLACQQRLSESLEMLENAVAHFAQNVTSTRSDLAMTQIIARRFDDAEETLRSTFELFPQGHYLPYMHLAILSEARGDTEGAVRAIGQVPVSVLESTLTLGLKYLFAGLAGDREGARKGYEHLLETKTSGPVFIPASQIAMAAIGAGDRDAAVEQLTESALVERDPMINWLAVLPFDRHLYGHAGFERLVTDILKLKLYPPYII